MKGKRDREKRGNELKLETRRKSSKKERKQGR